MIGKYVVKSPFHSVYEGAVFLSFHFTYAPESLIRGEVKILITIVQNFQNSIAAGVGALLDFPIMMIGEAKIVF